MMFFIFGTIQNLNSKENLENIIIIKYYKTKKKKIIVEKIMQIMIFIF